jgi:hypothetical protein
MNKSFSFGKSLLLTFVFAGIAFVGILHHEIWLDEAHHWLLARDSNSIGELIHNCRYEGHPMLWNFMLYGLAHFTADPFAMQVLNLALVAAGVFLFLRFGPFSGTEKLFFIFSYFILFEYTVIARSYGLVFLMLIIVACFYRSRKEHFILFSVLLILLSQTHFMAAIIAAGIFCLVTYEFKSRQQFPQWYYAGLAIFLISLVLVFMQAIPPKDHFIYTVDNEGWLSAKRIGKGMAGMWKGLFPVPDITSHYPWNSNLLINNSRWIGIIPAIIGWFVPFFVLGRDKKAIFFFYACSAAIACFIYFSPLGLSIRYCGFYFLLLIFSLWISERRLKYKLSKQLLYFIFTCQVIGGIYLFYTDYKRPFSNGKVVAEWIRKNVDPKTEVMVSYYFSGPPVSAYLGRKIYYPENNAEESFCKWNTKAFSLTDEELLFRVYAELKKSNEDHVWLVLDKPLEKFPFEKHPEINTFKIEQVIQFRDAMVKSENYTIYKITKAWEDEKPIY